MHVIEKKKCRDTLKKCMAYLLLCVKNKEIKPLMRTKPVKDDSVKYFQQKWRFIS